MSNNIFIGDYAGRTLRGGSNIVLIGDRMHEATAHLPDNYVSIAGVCERVVDDPKWSAACAEFQDEMLLIGAPAAIAHLVEPFGIDPCASRKATAAALSSIRQSKQARKSA